MRCRLRDAAGERMVTKVEASLAMFIAKLDAWATCSQQMHIHDSPTRCHRKLA